MRAARSPPSAVSLCQPCGCPARARWVPFGMPFSSCVIRALRKLRSLLAGYSRAHKMGDTTDTGVLAAKVETTTRMGKVAYLLRAGTKWGVVTICREPDRVAVEHEVNELWARQHRPSPSSGKCHHLRWASCATRFFSNLSRCTSGKSTASRCWLADGARRSSRRAFRPLINLLIRRNLREHPSPALMPLWPAGMPIINWQ